MGLESEYRTVLVARPLRVLHVIPAVAPCYGGTSTAIWPMIAASRELGGIYAEFATIDVHGPGDHLTRTNWSAFPMRLRGCA